LVHALELPGEQRVFGARFFQRQVAVAVAVGGAELALDLLLETLPLVQFDPGFFRCGRRRCRCRFGLGRGLLRRRSFAARLVEGRLGCFYLLRRPWPLFYPARTICGFNRLALEVCFPLLGPVAKSGQHDKRDRGQDRPAFARRHLYGSRGRDAQRAPLDRRRRLHAHAPLRQDHFLPLIDGLRALLFVQPQRPLDRVQETLAVLAARGGEAGAEGIAADAAHRVGRVLVDDRAVEHAAHGVEVGPGALLAFARVLLERSVAGR